MFAKQKMSTKHNTTLLRIYHPLLNKTCNINEEQEWSILEKEIISILHSRKSTKSLEELYRIVDCLCTKKYELLFCNLQRIIEEYLYEQLEIFNRYNDDILIILDKLWREFCRNIKTIKNIFLPVTQLNKTITHKTIHNMSLSAFIQIIVTNLEIKSKTLNALLDLIYQERVKGNENITNKILIKSIIEIFNTLQIYEMFQNVFLRHTQQFYENEARNMISSNLSHYLKHTNRRIVEESNRIENYLNRTTEKPLLDIIYYEFIGNYLTKILDNGFNDLIDRNMFEELSLIYKLFQRNQKTFKYLINYFNNLIIIKGMSLIESINDKFLIENLLDFKQNLEKIIERSFNQNLEFYNSIRLMFKKLINPNNNNKIAQLLAKYIDNKLCSKYITDDDDFDIIIIKVLQLFKYLQYKDIFEEFYKRYLAKRLLFNKSTNIDAENNLIMKLKLECGDNFTINIENMLQDINISKIINLRYKQKHINYRFFINILTNSYWPYYPNYKINLPIELINYQQSFEQFYNNYHNGRKLLWQSTLSFCIIRTKLNRNQKELQTSLYQTIILLLYNNNDSLSLNDIYELTGLEMNELERTLLSLKQNKILICSNNLYSINLNYTNRLYRIKINSIQLNETFQQKLDVEQKVSIDRQYQIDAAIVRIMKNYKTIQHNLLMNELYKILEIPIKQSDIKKRIELLIEREYMARDNDNRASYIYIA